MDDDISVEDALDRGQPQDLAEIWHSAYMQQLCRETVANPDLYGGSPQILERLRARLNALPEVTALQGLRAEMKLRSVFSTWHEVLVQQAYSEVGSWTPIGDILGMTRQGAWGQYHDAEGPDDDSIAAALRTAQEELNDLRGELDGMSDMARKARDHSNEMIDALHRAICEAVGWDPQAAWPGNRAAATALLELRQRAESAEGVR